MKFQGSTPYLLFPAMTTYEPMGVSTATNFKEKMVQFAAFEATYHDSITTITPDMVPLIIVTGASIS
jgi:hypothetical protein